MKFITERVKTLKGNDNNIESTVLIAANALLNEDYDIVRIELDLSNRFTVEFTKEDLVDLKNWVQKINEFKKEHIKPANITTIVLDFPRRTPMAYGIYPDYSLEDIYTAAKILSNKEILPEHSIEDDTIIFIFKD